MAIYTFFNGAAAALAAVVPPVATGNTIKTMLQVKGVANIPAKIKEWGINFDGAAVANIQAELIETGTIFATVTAYAAGDIVAVDAMALLATSTAYFSVGTSASGFTASAEGSIVASRLFDSELITCPAVGAGAQYIKGWALGNEPVINLVSALRIRVKASASGNAAVCWVTVEV